MSSSYPEAFTSFFLQKKKEQTVSARQPTTPYHLQKKWLDNHRSWGDLITTRRLPPNSPPQRAPTSVPDLPSTPHFVALATRVGWDESQSFVATTPKRRWKPSTFLFQIWRGMEMSKASTKTYLLKDPPKNVSLSTICNLTWWEFHLPPYFRSPKELKHHPNSLSLMPTLKFSS